MTDRAMLSIMVLVIAPVVIATWILATFTVGEQLDAGNAMLIGFAVALLAVATAVSILFLTAAPSGSQVGLVLIICGAACIIAAIALQFYLASVTAQNSLRIVEILGEQLKMNPNPSAHLNVKADYPGTVQSISYFAIFAGIWMTAVGARIGVGSNGSSDNSSSSVASNKESQAPNGS